MITFKQFLTEAAAGDMSKLEDKQVIRDALMAMHKLDPAKMKAYFKPATASNIMSVYSKFYDDYPAAAKAISRYNQTDGIGPGEPLFYFLFDNVTIGGKNAPIDIFVNGKPFAEVKAGSKGPGPDVAGDFKLSKDGAESSVKLFKDLKAFNDKYLDITGEDLPSWDRPEASSTSAINSWRGIDLEELAKTSTGGGKKPVSLIMKKDGDVTVKGDTDPVMNVKKEKSVKPLADLISDTSAVKLTPADKAVSTLEKIIERWADAILDDYLKGKQLAIVDSASGRLLFFGTVKNEQIDLLKCHRNQPWVKIFLKGSRKDQPVKAAKAPGKDKESLEDIGKDLAKGGKKR